jgi:hypothetical protein
VRRARNMLSVTIACQVFLKNVGSNVDQSFSEGAFVLVIGQKCPYRNILK